MEGIIILPGGRLIKMECVCFVRYSSAFKTDKNQLAAVFPVWCVGESEGLKHRRPGSTWKL